jgi:hypothetical protein
MLIKELKKIEAKQTLLVLENTKDRIEANYAYSTHCKDPSEAIRLIKELKNIEGKRTFFAYSRIKKD